MLSWQKYYELHRGEGSINEIAAQYNMYVYQNEEQYDVELIRKLGNNGLFILQENGDILLQEGFHQYGLMQEY